MGAVRSQTAVLRTSQPVRVRGCNADRCFRQNLASFGALHRKPAEY